MDEFSPSPALPVGAGNAQIIQFKVQSAKFELEVN